jgi:hypothetical protein
LNRAQQQRLIDLVGEDAAIRIAMEFPNVKLPGKKFAKRVLRGLLNARPGGQAGLDFWLRYGRWYQELFRRKVSRPGFSIRMKK